MGYRRLSFTILFEARKTATDLFLTINKDISKKRVRNTKRRSWKSVEVLNRSNLITINVPFIFAVLKAQVEFARARIKILNLRIILKAWWERNPADGSSRQLYSHRSEPFVSVARRLRSAPKPFVNKLAMKVLLDCRYLWKASVKWLISHFYCNITKLNPLP